MFDDDEIASQMWTQLKQNGVIEPGYLAQMMHKYKESNETRVTVYIVVGGSGATILASVITAMVFKRKISKLIGRPTPGPDSTFELGPVRARV